MRIFIVGAGEVGYHIAHSLVREGHDLVVVDKDPQRVKHLEASLDLLAVQGDGCDAALLRRHGVDGAERLFAVTDHGWWFGATLIEDGDDLSLDNARLAKMRDVEGDYLKENNRTRDAEGLTRFGDHMVVSFEGGHRLMLLGEGGRLGATIQSSEFEHFIGNYGLEGILAGARAQEKTALAAAADAG